MSAIKDTGVLHVGRTGRTEATGYKNASGKWSLLCCAEPEAGHPSGQGFSVQTAVAHCTEEQQRVQPAEESHLLFLPPPETPLE